MKSFEPQCEGTNPDPKADREDAQAKAQGLNPGERDTFAELVQAQQSYDERVRFFPGKENDFLGTPGERLVDLMRACVRIELEWEEAKRDDDHYGHGFENGVRHARGRIALIFGPVANECPSLDTLIAEIEEKLTRLENLEHRMASLEK